MDASGPYRQQIFGSFFHEPVRIVHALVVKIRRQVFNDEVEQQARGKVADFLFCVPGKNNP